MQLLSKAAFKSKYSLFLCATVFLTACSSQETLNRVEDVSTYSDTAQISEIEIAENSTPTETADGAIAQISRVIVFRDSPISIITSPKFRIDGQDMGRCAFGRKTIVEVNPGFHQMSSFSETKNTRKFQIEAGETAYVRCTPVLGLLVPNVRLDFVGAQEGQRASAKMKEHLVPLFTPTMAQEN